MDLIDENHDSGSTEWNVCLLCGFNSLRSPKPHSYSATATEPVAIDKLARACCKLFKLPVKQWYDELRRGAGVGDTELGRCYCEPCAEILLKIHDAWVQLNELHVKIGELRCQVVTTLQNAVTTDGVDVSPRIGLTRKKLIKALKLSRKLYEVDSEALAPPIDIKIEEEDPESIPSSPIADQFLVDEDNHDFMPPPSLIPQSPESHSSELGENPPEEAEEPKVKKRRKKRVRALSPSTMQRLSDEIHTSQRQLHIPLKRVHRHEADGRWIVPRFKYSQPPGYTPKWRKYKLGRRKVQVPSPARSKLKKKKTPKAVGPSFVCEVCSKTYFFEIRFKRHLLRHQSDSETPKQKELSAKVEHLCRFCGKTFHSQYYTQRHELFQHGSGNITGGPQLWKCTWPGCKYHCFGRYRFMVHETGHKNERNHQCPVEGCGKTYNHKKGLAAHMLTHTGQRPYKCTQDGCEAAFRARMHLRNHEKVIHEKAEAFRCELCGAGFPIRKYLIRHLEKHAKGKI